LLLIDDLHDIRGGSLLAPILVQLREIGSVASVSLGCFATREIVYVLRQDDQLTTSLDRRNARWAMPGYSISWSERVASMRSDGALASEAPH
jgi:hypothetical protein